MNPDPRPIDSSSSLTAALPGVGVLLAQVFAETEDGVFMKDLDGRYVMVNARVAAFFGRTVDEILGRTDFDLVPAERARFFHAHDRRVIEQGSAQSYEVETRLGTRRIHVHTTKSPIRDAEGRVVGVIGIGRDVSARRELEDALRLSETRLAAAQAIAHLGSWEWNLRTNAVIWSDECYRIFGVDPAHFRPTYAEISKHFHAADAERFRGALAAAVRHGSEFRDDFRIVRPSGEERHLHVEGVVTRHDAQGIPVIMTGTSVDITERKLTELALRRSEANFTHAQRIAQVGSWAWVPSTREIHWSAEARRIFGLPGEAGVPMPEAEFTNTIHPEDRATVSRAIEQTLQGEISFDEVFRVVLPDGSVRSIHSLGELHPDFDDAPLMTGVCRDITEQLRIHAQLINSEANLAQAQRIARMASWRWDMLTGRQVWSDEIYDILEAPREPPIDHRAFLHYVHAEDRREVSAAFYPTTVGMAPASLDFRITTGSGRERFIHSLGQTVVNADGRVTAIIGILQDITDRKRTEEALAVSRDELRALAEHLQHVQEDERRRIAREIHDEFGAVFTAANLSLHRLATRLKGAPQATRELLASTTEMIRNAGTSLDDVVNGLHPAMLNHLGLVATMSWYLDEFEKRTGLRCQRTLPAESEDFDEHQTLALFRCLQESLTNVAKHAAATRVAAALTVDDVRIVLTVTDDGSGFAPEALAAANAFGIRGLRARMTQLGGQLQLRTVHPQGTCVTATLPRNITEEETPHD